MKAWHRKHGAWPSLPSPLVASLDLTGEDIEEAVEGGFLRVDYLPGGRTPRLEAP